MMWQHKELHDGFKRAGLKEADFYCGSASAKGGTNHSATLARPIASQVGEMDWIIDQINVFKGREKPRPIANDPNETMSSGGGGGGQTYGTMGDTIIVSHPFHYLRM